MPIRPRWPAHRDRVDANTLGGHADTPSIGGTLFDILIVNATLVTQNGDRDILDGWIGITDGVIAGIEPGRPDDSVVAARTIDANGGIVHPGYVSVHQHTMDTLGRAGTGDLEPFFDWLFGTYYGGVLGYSVEDARLAATLAASDLRRAGVTTLLDCWSVGDPGSDRSRACFDATVEVARASGLRWILAPMVADTLPDAWHEDLERMTTATFQAHRMITSTKMALRSARQSIDAVLRDPGLVDVWVSPELPEMASDALLTGLSAIAATTDAGFTTHLNASPASAAGDGSERAVERLERLGVLGASRVLAAHTASTTPDERELLAWRNVGVGHCATSSMFAGAGRSAAGELRSVGIAVGLGLDNATLNVPANMVGEMRSALQFDRVVPSGSQRLSVQDLLAMATIEGARALGLDARIGSLEIGKQADLVVLDTAGSHWLPRRTADVGIVLQSRADDIRLVLVSGEPVYAAPAV